MKIHKLLSAFNSIIPAMVLVLGAAPNIANAEGAWPSKPIRVIVPFAAGGIVDVIARSVTEKLVPVLGQPIIVEARPGADANIGTEAVARSAGDGYTWLVVAMAFTSQLNLNPKAVRYDPVKDFQPVINLTINPTVSVVPATLPVNTLKEFVAYAKARSGRLFYASPAIGGAIHLSTELFNRAAGIDMTHIVYKGQTLTLVDLLAGRIDFMNLTIAMAAPLVKSGKLKALAVIDTERNKMLPDVPTAAEAGYPEIVLLAWTGLVMPAQTPREIVQKVNLEVSKVLQSPEVIEKLQANGVHPAKPNSPEEFDAYIKTEIARLAKVINEAKIKSN